MSLKIIIAEDEDITRKHLLRALKAEGYEAVGSKDGIEALTQINQEHFDVLITDVRMPGMNGIELLERVKEKYPSVEVLVITGYGSIDAAVEAMKKGAYEYIAKPFNLDELIIKVKNLHERKILKSQNAALRTFLGMNKELSLIARSESMQRIVAIVEGMKNSDGNIFLTGESGVGKSLLARIIHFTSGRQGMPFLSINCSTLKEEPLASELFGHEKGAYPEADKTKHGLIEIADGGTLYLEEITEIPLKTQANLLKVIENGEVLRVAGKTSVRINVRLIAAATRDVKELIAQDRFMENLYRRLSPTEIRIPPLREHKEDIEPLCIQFLGRHPFGPNKKTGLSKESLDILMNYSFPGNIRELGNIIERAVILEQGPVITPDSLPISIKKFRIETFPPERIKTIDELTRDHVVKVLDLVDGDKVKAAELLGISEIGLWRILKGERD